MEHNKIIERFAEIQGITYEEAANLISGETDEEILDSITNYTKAKITSNLPPLNRKQRRALQKKLGKKKINDADIISGTAEKLNYIDLIQKLRKLNEEKEKENNEDLTENN